MPHKDLAKQAAYSAAYRLRQGKEAIAADRKRWRLSRLAECREKERLQKQRQREKAPERFRAAQRRYNQKHPEYFRRYVKSHPNIIQAQYNRRRALKRNAPVNDFTAAQWAAMKAHYKFRCVYCGRKQKLLTMDHIQPLSQGGSHTLRNIVPACRPCNSRKNAGPPPKPVQPLLL
jgi:5-methylcytosine-specific restriction endonuclease McrA